VKLEEDKLIKR